MAHTHPDNDDSNVVDINDPWSTESSNYSEYEFYTRAMDRKGHREKVQLAMPPHMMAQIGALVASKMFSDYRTPQDFFRDAAVHRLKFVADLAKSEELQKTVDKEIALVRIEQLNTRIKDSEQTVERLNELCMKLETVSKTSNAWRDLKELMQVSRSEVMDYHIPRINQLIERYCAE